MLQSTKPKASSSLQSAVAPVLGAHTATQRWYWATTIGTKVLMAVTGLLLVVYLVLHLAGNLLLYFGPPMFNAYAYFLIKNPLIVPIEIGLASIFVIHIYKAITNWVSNRRARPVPYYQPMRRFFGWGWAGGPSRKSFASVTMLFSGLITLLFVVIHVRQLKFGAEYLIVNASGEEVRDLYRLVIETFKSPINSAFYIFCMIVLGLHLWHGFSSAFNSLGAAHPRYSRWILGIGKAVTFVIAGGFITIPLWVYFFGVI